LTNHERSQVNKVAPWFRVGVQKQAQTMIPFGDIKYLRVEHDEKVYAIRSPLTHNWIEFRVSAQFLRVNRDSYPAHVSAIIRYYDETAELLESARAIAPLNRDLTALDKEESQIFGVKKPDGLTAPKTEPKRYRRDTLGKLEWD
jgi:hypothetical protein